MIRATCVLAGGLAALLWTAGAQACFVVANGTITFNSMVSPPGCGGIANAFPTQMAAQNFLNSLQAPAPTGGGAMAGAAPAPTATPAAAAPATTTTVTGATAATPMPSTAMQVFMLTTPDKAAAASHERLLYDTMLNHPNQRPFMELGIVTALLADHMVHFTNLFFYHWQVRREVARAEWDMTPEGQAARRQGKDAADRAFWESDANKRLDAEMKERQAFAANSSLFFLQDDGRSATSWSEIEGGSYDGGMRTLELPGTPPPDGPPESILDSIGDFVTIS